ncbi:hypothetical protein B1H18_16525 [Streptomyces tsukubensis]|uniref:Uncharacterized protein n=1 Tax=Streptomyces tsukubensis TaxID=83656 RepID=A0A1V4A7L6_9ACTN|nr:hypothetical protein B1H18_16525 [Streptomyces tsukubensis]
MDAWDNESGKEFREKAKGNVKKLDAAYKRYDAAADAIGARVDEVGGSFADKNTAKPKNYASDLNRAQEMAEIARQEAKDAEERKGTAQKALDGLSDKKHSGGDKDAGSDKDPDKAKRKDMEGSVQRAGAEIEAARKKIEDAKRVRNAAAKQAIDAIEDVISDDSLKDGFWDTLVQQIADITALISTWCGILSLVVGWIPVIGQALAGVLGAVAMIATLVNTLATLVQVFQGNADWVDLGFSALGFLMMGAGKAFSKVAGKFAKTGLARMGRAGKASTRAQEKRATKNLRKLSNRSNKLERGDILKSLKEPFTEPFSKSAWSTNLKALKPGGGGYGVARNQLAERGGGSAIKGAGKSFSMADPGVASDLKAIKLGAGNVSHLDPVAVNKISKSAGRLGVVGAGLTLGGLGLDSNLNPLLG